MRSTLLCLAVLLTALKASPAAADTDIRIGPGAGCSPAGTNIQAAINAADPVLGVTRILISRDSDLSSPGETPYSGQQLDISGKNVHLIGGYDSCLASTPTAAARTVISGFGGGSNSVITIRGSSSGVVLRNLLITGGDEVTSTNGFGGGIDISGGPHNGIVLENVLIQNNVAGFGGGISIKNATPSNQAAVRLVLDQNNLIDQNNAHQGGGGIYCEDSTIEMVRPNSAIRQNVAGTGTNSGPGGGMRLQNCVMHMASSTLVGTVSANAASGPGGGISITGERARLDMYNLLPNKPTMISLNTAGGVGGGIDIGSSARVYGFDIIIDGNTSRSGGGGVAIFDNDGFNDNAGEFIMQGTLNGAPAGAVNCVDTLDCNRLSNNLARSVAGSDQAGAALRVNGSDAGLARVKLYGSRLDHNAGRSLIYQVDTRGTVLLDGVLIDHNTVSADLLNSPARSLLQIFGTTIAENAIALSVMRTTSNTEVRRSLVWQPGKPLLTVIEGSLRTDEVEYVLANDLSGSPANDTNRIVNATEAGFVDAAAGNFRLQPWSAALDYAPPAAGVTRDRFARNVDILQIPEDSNHFGSQDVGAYELQAGEGFNSAPALSIASPFTMIEDRQKALQGFSLSDPDGDIDGGLYVTSPSGTLFGLYWSGVTATQLTPNSIVIEGPLSRITNDTATFDGVTAFTPESNFFGEVPIEFDLTDFGNTGFGVPLWAHATLTVNVLPVNDPPTLQIPDILHSASEVGSHVVELGPLSTISVGPPNEADQSVYGYFQLSTQDPQQVFGTPPTLAPDGKLAFTLSGNAGVAQLSARITDTGGTENGGIDTSAPATFFIRVSAASAPFSDGFEGAN